MEKELSMLRRLFNKYDTHDDGYLRLEEFGLLLDVLSEHIPTLKNRGDEITKAVYSLLSGDSDYLYFEEFSEWWITYDFSLFTRHKDLVIRARRLFERYAEGENRMTKIGFQKLVSEVKTLSTQSDFFVLDSNSDSALSFKEFCVWLNWW